ncbi:putative gag/capsid-like protein [Operophtera brumata]|uniref:Putative gag/capsid-like protein n=1 Tax=Operophtera brumata TaxID=104452 RepID=A0A0L7LM35_OPEBR|nr:putative gag/capsid-like protein [Operophtera brumata]
MSIGKIREFDVKTGSWMSYVDRLDMYLKINDIKEELKMPTMISLMGDEAYELLVLGEGGNQVHRHIDQIKRRTRSSLVCPDSRDTTVSEEQQGTSIDVPQRMTEQIDSPTITCSAEPEPSEPLPDQPLDKDLQLTRPTRKCRLNKPNYKT